MNLYFDIGNTNIKLNVNYKNQEYYFNYETKSAKSVDTFYSQLPQEIKGQKIEKIFICSVVPFAEDILRGVVKKYWQIDPIMVKYPLKTGIKLKVDHPQSIGSDLVCLAAYVSQECEKGIIVNIGTATTIVVVDNKALEGAIICPGLMTSFESLIKKASKLAETNLETKTRNHYGKNTQEALSLGVLKGHAEMIKGLVRDIDDDHKLFISGGHSKKILDFMPEYQYVKEATIEGIKAIEKNNI